MLTVRDSSHQFLPSLSVCALQDEDTLESAKICDKSTLFLVMASARVLQLSPKPAKCPSRRHNFIVVCHDEVVQVKGASSASGGAETKANGWLCPFNMFRQAHPRKPLMLVLILRAVLASSAQLSSFYFLLVPPAIR